MTIAQRPWWRPRFQRFGRLFFGLSLGEARSVAHAVNVRIHRNHVSAKRKAHDNICAFAPDTRQQEQPFTRVGHDAIMFFQKGGTKFTDVAGLHVVEAGGFDCGGNFLIIERKDLAGRFAQCEQLAGCTRRVFITRLR